MPQITKTVDHSVGLNIFSQRFFPLAKDFYFTLQGDGSVSYRNNNRTTTTNSTKSETKTNGYGLGFSVAPGVSYRLARRLLLDLYLNDLLSIGYTHDQSAKGSTPTAMQARKSAFYLSSSLSRMSFSNIGVGLRWFLKSRYVHVSDEGHFKNIYWP